MNTSLPTKIRTQRTKFGLSQKELALKLKISSALVSHWETMRTPVAKKHLGKLSKALKFPIKH